MEVLVELRVMKKRNSGGGKKRLKMDDFFVFLLFGRKRRLKNVLYKITQNIYYKKIYIQISSAANSIKKKKNEGRSAILIFVKLRDSSALRFFFGTVYYCFEYMTPVDAAI